MRGITEAPNYWDLGDAELRALVDAANERDKSWTKLFRFGVGVIAAEVRNTMRSKSSQKIWTAEDFMPREVKQLKPETIRELMIGWAQANGAEVTHG